MSLILDALRGGSPRATPRPNSNAAQTDAVLQTLGYGRFSATSPFNRLKRFLGYLVVGIMFAVVIWGAVVWVTTPYLSHEAPMEVYNAVLRRRDGPPAPAPGASDAAAADQPVLPPPGVCRRPCGAASRGSAPPAFAVRAPGRSPALARRGTLRGAPCPCRDGGPARPRAADAADRPEFAPA